MIFPLRKSRSVKLPIALNSLRPQCFFNVIIDCFGLLQIMILWPRLTVHISYTEDPETVLKCAMALLYYLFRS